MKKKSKEGKFNTFVASLYEKLYANEAQGLYVLVSFFPFFVASWTAGGFVINKLQTFIVVSIILISKSYGKTLLENKKLIFKKEFFLVLMALNLGLVLYYYSLTSLISPSLLLLLSIVLFYLENELDNSEPKKIILKAFSLITRMSVYSLIGIASQLFDKDFKFGFAYMAFGFVPAGILASSQIARFSQIFLNNSWLKQKNDKPASLVRLIVLFLIFIPAIPLMLTPFDFFPTPFLLTAFMFGKLIKTVEVYSKTEKADKMVFFDLSNYALLMSVLMLVIGALIRVLA